MQTEYLNRGYGSVKRSAVWTMHSNGAAQFNEKGWSLLQIENHQQSGTNILHKLWIILKRSLVKSNGINNSNHRCGLTTQAQGPGPRGAWIATGAQWPASLQRMVRRCALVYHLCVLHHPAMSSFALSA